MIRVNGETKGYPEVEAARRYDEHEQRYERVDTEVSLKVMYRFNDVRIDAGLQRCRGPAIYLS